MLLATNARQRGDEPQTKPRDATNTPRKPPARGSDEEAAATAKRVGYPGAFDFTCALTEREIRARLLWEF